MAQKIKEVNIKENQENLANLSNKNYFEEEKLEQNYKNSKNYKQSLKEQKFIEEEKQQNSKKSKKQQQQQKTEAKIANEELSLLQKTICQNKREILSSKTSFQKVLKKDKKITSTVHGFIKYENTYQKDNFIDGLIYIPNFLTKEEGQQIQQELDSGIWDSANNNRRTIQYGHYFYWERKQRLSTLEPPYDKMPASCINPLQRLKEEKLIPKSYEFDQCIVNDYKGYQGIKPHVDRDCFDEYIAGFSLLEPVVMDFRHSKTKKTKAILIEPLSLLLLSGESRHIWQHSIYENNQHIYQGTVISRSRRTSLTFRKILDRTKIKGHKIYGQEEELVEEEKQQSEEEEQVLSEEEKQAYDEKLEDDQENQSPVNN